MLIIVSGGAVEVQANVPGIEVTINDTDQQQVGEPYTTTLRLKPAALRLTGGSPVHR